MNNESLEFIWIFNGARSHLPSAAFVEMEKAVAWIAEHRLTGILTRYPVNTGLYEWAIRMGYFKPKREEHMSAGFIGTFTCASLKHLHVEDGIIESVL